MNTIIFSKDRACQCDLLLSSMMKNAENLFGMVNVLYKASNKDFDLGYSRLIKKWKKSVYFAKEENFKKDLIHLTHSSHSTTQYLTDDDIFWRPLSIEEIDSINDVVSHKDIGAFSLRLGLNLKIQDFYTSSSIPYPEQMGKIGEALVWRHKHVQFHTNFSYLLSVDGNIYKTNDLIRVIDLFDYDNPNSFEGRIQKYTDQFADLYACLEKSCVVNTPMNRVQDTCTNRAGEIYGISAEEINNLWLADYYIDLNSMDFSHIVGCHQELPFNMNKESW